jgi:two-component system OmpR family response regulator
MRLLIIEDDPLLGDGISRLLKRDGYAVDWVKSGTSADASIRAEDYDALILDLELPGMDGFEVLSHLRRRGQRVPVLILTARDSVKDRVTGLDLGADDYLVKPFEFTELQARIRALIRRRHGNPSPTLVHGPLTLDTTGRRAWLHGQPLDLSVRDWGLLELLVPQAGRIVSKQRLLQALSGWGDEITLNAVEQYVHRLRAKLEPGGVVIRTVRGLGYMLERAPDNAG